MDRQSRNVLVTGASKGVGRGIAVGLAKDGWNVAVNYCRDKAGAEETVRSIRDLGRDAWLLQADIGFSDQVQSMFEQFTEHVGTIDLLVNNAGVQTWKAMLDLKEDDWDRTIRTNLKGTFLCTQQAGRLMQKTGGRIINIGSGANKAPFPMLSDYCASKGGIETFTTVAAVELGRYGITVNCIHPGTTRTERTAGLLAARATQLGMSADEIEHREFEPGSPQGNAICRMVDASEIAYLAAYLASDKAWAVTGEVIAAGGGVGNAVYY